MGLVTGLSVDHWPAPCECPACGLLALFWDAGRSRCTSVVCDPGAATWAELDQAFRRAAGLRLRRFRAVGEG